jgi:hypothetical protein
MDTSYGQQGHRGDYEDQVLFPELRESAINGCVHTLVDRFGVRGAKVWGEAFVAWDDNTFHSKTGESEGVYTG